ncbi:hypothetical protein [Luteimonas terricola]|uniref:hypothetical protein n=1 Tax=Luteimonas terricola TaxID=645597 RepID=UPI00351A1A9A
MAAFSNPVGQFHRYRYASGNPYTFKDPDGRKSSMRDHPCITQSLVSISMSGMAAAGAKTKTYSVKVLGDQVAVITPSNWSGNRGAQQVQVQFREGFP